MYRLLLRSAFAVALLAGTMTLAADAASDRYEYQPYSQQNQAGSDAASSPANSRGAAIAPSGNVAPNNGNEGSEPAYRGGGQQVPEPDQDDVGDRTDSAPPSPDDRASQRGYAQSRLIVATANAPDRSVPYNVREQDARRAAVEAWRSKAADRFGPEFSQWRVAQRKQIDCVRQRGDDAVCTASGVPVRSDVRPGDSDRDDRY
jgi:hypothetical protein